MVIVDGGARSADNTAGSDFRNLVEVVVASMSSRTENPPAS
jgi:hypothetical protein